MRTSNTVLGSILAMIGIAVVGAGCEFVPDPEFSALKDTLGLSIVAAKRNTAVGLLDFDLQLTNRGDSTAKACLGESRSVSSRAGSWSGTSSTFVDHPGCMREFTIAPGGNMAWRETLEVRHLPDEAVEAKVDVQIVKPRRCGNWGSCAAFELTSNEVSIP